MMKRRPSVLVALSTLLVALFVAFATATPALADYGYTIRIFPGNRGELPQDPVEVPVSKGGEVDLYKEAPVTITDSKYVQTGYRLSGTDKLYGDGVVRGVNEDMDFVVAYGVESNTVAYTIKYVEYETGKELAEPKTYYGTVGDKPVASYEYIEGYRPLYLAITGTLSAADNENVWTFEYVPTEEGETVVTTTTTTETTVVTTPGPTTTNTTVVGGGETTTTTEGGAAATTEGGAAATTEGGAAATTEGGAAGTEGGAAATEPPATQEILDLDTPLAGPNATSAAAGKKVGNDASLLTSPAVIAGIAVVGAAAAGLIIYLTKIKKDKADEEA